MVHDFCNIELKKFNPNLKFIFRFIRNTPGGGGT